MYLFYKEQIFISNDRKNIKLISLNRYRCLLLHSVLDQWYCISPEENASEGTYNFINKITQYLKSVTIIIISIQNCIGSRDYYLRNIHPVCRSTLS